VSDFQTHRENLIRIIKDELNKSGVLYPDGLTALATLVADRMLKEGHKLIMAARVDSAINQILGREPE